MAGDYDLGAMDSPLQFVGDNVVVPALYLPPPGGDENTNNCWRIQANANGILEFYRRESGVYQLRGEMGIIS